MRRGTIARHFGGFRRAATELSKGFVGFAAALLVCGIQGCQVFEALFGGQDKQPSATTRILWSVGSQTNAGLPWFTDSLVFFLGRTHEVSALSKGSGTLRWTVKLTVNRQFTVGFGGFAVGNLVVVGDQDLFALKMQDGAVVWRFAPTDGVDVGRDIPVRWNDLALTGSSNGRVYGVDLATGTQRWVTRLGDSTRVGTWVSEVAGGTLFVGFTDFEIMPNHEPQGGVAALDAATGAVRWITMHPHHADPTGPTGTTDPVAAGSVVVAESRDGPLYAYDRLTGAQRWKAAPMPVLGNPPPALIRDIRPLATCDNRVYAGSQSKFVVALDPETGNELWRTDPSSWGSAAWVWCGDHTVLVFRSGGQLEAYDDATGRHRWAITDDAYHFNIGGAIDGTRLYSGGLRGVYALKYD